MQLILLSDLHGDISCLAQITPAIRAADAVIVAGDITHFGRRSETQNITDKLRKLNPQIMAVAGNCDHHVVSAYLQEEGFMPANGTQKFGKNRYIFLGGSLPCPARTLSEIDDVTFAKELDRLHKLAARSSNLVLLMHQPPYNTEADLLPGGKHVGSLAIRAFIEKVKPLACFCGHIHESRSISYIGRTMIINPGSFRDGYYATINIRRWKITAELLQTDTVDRHTVRPNESQDTPNTNDSANIPYL